MCVSVYSLTHTWTDWWRVYLYAHTHTWTDWWRVYCICMLTHTHGQIDEVCILCYLMENFSAMVPGIQLGLYHLTDLEYADDAAMFATNQNDISSALAIFDAEACKLGLRTSWAKTKIMKFGDAPSPPSLHICNNDVEFVDKFTYLGSIITNTGNLQPDINRHIGLATGVMRSLRQPLWRHSSISLETKLRVYQASVLSVLLYGSECWPISTSLCIRLSAFDMQAQRTITNTKWFEFKTNIEVRTLTIRQPIQRYIAKGRLRWLGHLLRSPSNHPALAIYTFNQRAAGWSRPRGAPRTRWSDVLGKDLKQLGQHWWRLPTSPSTVPAGGQPLLLVPSPRPRGKSLS